jgi:hypothetical protein
MKSGSTKVTSALAAEGSVLSGQGSVRIRSGREGMAEKNPVPEQADSLKEILMRRYRTSFIDKLTAEDLAELKRYLEKEIDAEGNINPEYRDRFKEKLRNYFHESVLVREIVNIEALVRRLLPEDLK